MNRLIRVLAHLVLILSITSIVFLILNVYNPMMGFVSSNYSTAVFLLLFVLAGLLAVLVFTRAEAEKKDREDPRQ